MSRLLCGTAKQCITPPPELLSRLVGLKQYRFAGVLDELYVRALALGDERACTLLLSFDMTTAPCTREFLEQIARETGIPEERVLFFSIHTHAVPFNDIDLERREEQDEDTLAACREYTQLLHRRAMEAAKDAVGTMIPARMGWAWGESFVNVVRIQEYSYLDKGGQPFPVCNLGADPSKPADRTLFTLRAEDLDGKPLAFLVNYAMHNVTTIWNDCDGSGAMGVSGDVGGQVSRLLEEEHPGSVALWSSGAAGDLNPLMLNEVYLPDPRTGRTYSQPVRGLDTALYCLQIMSERHYADIKRTLCAVECSQENGETAGVVEWSRTPGVDCIRHQAAPPEFLTGPEVPEHTVRLQMVRVGGLTLLGAGAEVYSSIGAQMRAAAPGETVLITHNASALCRSHYLLDDGTLARCEASRGFAMVPGYDEYRCLPGISRDLTAHIRSMAAAIERRG